MTRSTQHNTTQHNTTQHTSIKKYIEYVLHIHHINPRLKKRLTIQRTGSQKTSHQN